MLFFFRKLFFRLYTLCFLVLILAGGCTSQNEILSSSSTAIQDESAENTVSLEKRMKGFEQFASRIRELEFKKPVKYISIRKRDVKEILDIKINEQFSEKQFTGKIEAYVKIGLLDSPDGIRETMLGMLGEQIAGFYDTDNHVLYVIDDLEWGPQFDAMIYVHELTHALQDQHFNLNSLGINDKSNDDRVIAVMSLIEGDATLVIMQYFTKYGKFDLKMLMQAMMMDSSKLNSAPYVLQKTLMFPYMDGMSLVRKIHKEKGWAGVDEAFNNPPASSEQILHPEKYLKELDEPTEVALPDFRRTLGKDWVLLDNNVMGELNTQILFDIHLGKRESKKPSEGWDGDRYVVFKNTKDESAVLVWLSVWDSAKDAEEFFASYKKLIEKKYAGEKFESGENEGPVLFSSEKINIYIALADNQVLTIETPEKRLIAKLIKKLNDNNNIWKLNEDTK